MKRWCIFPTSLVVLFLACVPIFGQSSDSQSSSLGDLARKVRAEKSKDKSKPAMVVTNDTIPHAEAITDNSPANKTETSGGKQTPEGSKSADAAKPKQGEHNEAYYRSQKASLQARLDLDQRELSVLQQKLGQNDMQYYNDPNKTLQQEYSRSDITKLQDEITKKQQQIADDQKALDDLRDQLRREGGDPGWLR